MMKLSIFTTAAVAIVVAVMALFANFCDGKNILLSFDGTGNGPLDAYNPVTNKNGTITNALKLHLLCGGSIDNQQNEDKDKQICIYKRGLGAISDNKFLNKFNFIRGLLDQQIKPMLKWLEAVYEKDDKLYIIGFSRGATSARQFVSILHEKGLHTRTKELVKNPHVAFLGCFDTVSMQAAKRLFPLLARSSKHWFSDLIGKDVVPKHMRSSVTVGEENGKISNNDTKIVHNLALDDNRMLQPFPIFQPPILMDSKDPRVTEVWFAGGHDDVGGKYYEKGMGDYSLLHMKEWMEKCGLAFLNWDDINKKSLKIEGHPNVKILPEHLKIVPNATEEINIPKQTSYRPVIAATNDNQDVFVGGSIKIHVSVLLHAQQCQIPYEINPLLMKLAPSVESIVLVGKHGKLLENETKVFRELLLQWNSTTIM